MHECVGLVFVCFGDDDVVWSERKTKQVVDVPNSMTELDEMLVRRADA